MAPVKRGIASKAAAVNRRTGTLVAGTPAPAIAGTDCQWIDVTSVDTSGGPVSAPLVFEANPDGFLCEGVPRTGPDGELL